MAATAALDKRVCALAAAALCCIAVISVQPSWGLNEATAGVRGPVQLRQQLMYDSVTVGPYGGYDSRTYYMNPTEGGDGGMYQSIGANYNRVEYVDDNIYQNFQAPEKKEGPQLLPYDINDVMYQGGFYGEPETRTSIVPWTWGDVMYQGDAGPPSNGMMQTDWDDVIYQEPLPAASEEVTPNELYMKRQVPRGRRAPQGLGLRGLRYV